MIRRRSQCPKKCPVHVRPRPTGFTLIELLIAIALFSIALAITFSTFHGVTRAWQRGLAMSEDLNHGEYVMDQLVTGLRCAFYPPARSNAAGSSYGFIFEDHGDDAEARDVISWVKSGASLLGMDDALAKGLHRVQVTVEEDEDNRPGVAVRAWRPYLSPEFQSSSIQPVFAAWRVAGLNCRVSTNHAEDGWEWQDDWEDDATNHLPLAVELTLYLEPLEKGEPPVAMRRLVEIPLAPLSWSKK